MDQPGCLQRCGTTCNCDYRGGGVFLAGVIWWEVFVFEEGGKMFPWRNSWALAVQRVREAV